MLLNEKKKNRLSGKYQEHENKLLKLKERAPVDGSIYEQCCTFPTGVRRSLYRMENTHKKRAKDGKEKTSSSCEETRESSRKVTCNGCCREEACWMNHF